MIVLVCGLPGSGKTFFAQHLAKKLKAFYISSDQKRIQLSKSGSYSDQDKAMVYNEILKDTLAQSALNNHIVVDATFYKEAFRRLFTKAANESKVKLLMVKIVANEKDIELRTNKKRKFSEADFNVYKQIEAAFEPIVQDHLILNSSKEAIEEMIHKTMEYIK